MASTGHAPDHVKRDQRLSAGLEEHSIKKLSDVSKLNFIAGVLKTAYHMAVYLYRRQNDHTQLEEGMHLV